MSSEGGATDLCPFSRDSPALIVFPLQSSRCSSRSPHSFRTRSSSSVIEGSSRCAGRRRVLPSSSPSLELATSLRTPRCGFHITLRHPSRQARSFPLRPSLLLSSSSPGSSHPLTARRPHSGAGDSLVGAVIAGLAQHQGIDVVQDDRAWTRLIERGQQAARASLRSEAAVSPLLGQVEEEWRLE